MRIDKSSDINSVLNLKKTYNDISKVDENKSLIDTKDQDKAALKKTSTSDEDSAKEAVYGKVIGVSQNGDTASAKEEAIKALNDGMVFKKDEKIDSLTQYTEDQLTMLYQQGRINKFKYDQEISRRDQIKKEALGDDTKVEDKKDEDGVPNIGDAKDSKDDADEKSDVTSVKDEIEKDNKFTKNMADLVADKQNEVNRAKAVEDAIANNRMSIMNDVFNGTGNSG